MAPKSTLWIVEVGRKNRHNCFVIDGEAVVRVADGLPISTLCILDTTVQPKNVLFPTDARLLNRAREILVRLAKRYGVKPRHSYASWSEFAMFELQRYAHVRQLKRAPTEP